MSGAALGKVAAAARPRRKVLSAEEAELFELAQAAGSGLDPEVFKVLLDLLRMNVAPLAVFQVLKSMCAGQRLPAGNESGAPAAPAPLPADSRVFQGENFTVADEYMLTREEFCSKTEKENFCQQPLCWEHRTMEKRKPWLSAPAYLMVRPTESGSERQDSLEYLQAVGFRVSAENAGLGFSLSWCLVLVVEEKFGLLSQHIHPWPNADGQCCASLPEGLVFPVVSGVFFILFNFLEDFAALGLIAVADFK
ncbi:uncharacterized protein LOC121075989 isoform X1 [Cygnus olor]|uniref:uncharacterized protein LOC121075989 isoform X1 n=1 Tax=Cygnus olor TaxID=8869 RepID=UPI001ADE44F0|nr:uncharacterized protein LOC121075989 isoform X1 [Cygnus olor]XP_040425770.1 uncharacterized protein LOC121075989 isoform X1 [Cygnus olor]